MSRLKRKYTLELDIELVDRALKASHKNFTDTVKEGLRILAASHAYEAVLAMEGTMRDLEIDIKELRKEKRDLL